MKQIVWLTCCCCGKDTKGRQWYNRDEGYGLCDDCASYLKTREAPEEMHTHYGVEGVHYLVDDKIRI